MRTLICSLLTLLLAMPCLANPAERPQQVTIAVIDDVPSTLLAVALMQEAYARLGIEMHTQTLPSRRALYQADHGYLDGDLFRIAEVADAYPNLVRVDYPLIHGGLYAVVTDHQQQQLPRNTDGKPLKAAIRRGVLIAEQTTEALGMSPVRAENYAQILRLVERQRVHLALLSDIEGLSPIRQPEWHHLHIIEQPVVRFTLYHYLNQRHRQLALELAATLAQMEQENIKARLIQRLTSATPATAPQPARPD